MSTNARVIDYPEEDVSKVTWHL